MEEAGKTDCPTTPAAVPLAYERHPPDTPWPIGVFVGAFVVALVFGMFLVVAVAIVMMPGWGEVPIRILATAIAAAIGGWLVYVCIRPCRAYDRLQRRALRLGVLAALVAWIVLIATLLMPLRAF